MTTTVVGDASATVRGQEEHLPFPTVGVERPAVTEHHRLCDPPILVVNLCSVFRGERAHVISLSLLGPRRRRPASRLPLPYLRLQTANLLAGPRGHMMFYRSY
jgi:hypothetical protein